MPIFSRTTANSLTFRQEARAVNSLPTHQDQEGRPEVFLRQIGAADPPVAVLTELLVVEGEGWLIPSRSNTPPSTIRR